MHNHFRDLQRIRSADRRRRTGETAMTDACRSRNPIPATPRRVRNAGAARRRLRRAAGVLVVLLLLAGIAAPAAAQTLPRVLYVTQSAGFAHPVLPLSEQVLPAIGREHDAFEVDVTRDASILTADVLARYDAVVFYTTGELPLDAGQKAAFLDFVRGGGGFAGIHSATDTFYEWPAYGALVGGYFDNHPWRQEVEIRVEDQDHAATRHLGASFRISDEIYQFRDWERSRVDVLLSLDTASVDAQKPGVRRTDGDFALAWTRNYGDGRMFYTALGHEDAVWRDERFQRLVVNGIVWAMGDPGGRTAQDAWRPLFDGTTTAAWRGYRRDALPEGWQGVDGALARVARGGDIVTVEQFENFELRFEWQVEEGGNSGVFFGVTEEVDAPVWHSGPEFQILHNADHRDGRAPITAAGSNYAVHPPAADVTRPVGEWNTSRLIVDRGRVEHWMNGMHLLTYQLGDADWQARVAASKFAPLPRYGRVPRGHVAIQDHGDPVRFRNILIREID